MRPLNGSRPGRERHPASGQWEGPHDGRPRRRIETEEPASSESPRPSKQSPGALHPGGWGAVPIVLMRHHNAKTRHLATYAAVASCVSYRTGIAPYLHLRRIAERARVTRRTAQRALEDLVLWGFLKISREKGRPSRYVLLPTTTAKAAEETERRADTIAADPQVSGSTGGRPKKGCVTGAPTLSSTRSFTGAERGRQNGLVVVSSATKGGVLSDTTPQSITQRVVQKTARAPVTDQPVITAQFVKQLRKAVGKRMANAAIEEVEFRMQHPEVASRVRRPATLARTIADCYAGRCSRNHSSLHGEEALRYHQARRADIAQEHRAYRRDVTPVSLNRTDRSPDRITPADFQSYLTQSPTDGAAASPPAHDSRGIRPNRANVV